MAPVLPTWVVMPAICISTVAACTAWLYSPASFSEAFVLRFTCAPPARCNTLSCCALILESSFVDSFWALCIWCSRWFSVSERALAFAAMPEGSWLPGLPPRSTLWLWSSHTALSRHAYGSRGCRRWPP